MDLFADRIKKEIKVQCSKARGRSTGQYFIQLPKEAVRELGIKKGEKVIIDIPLKERGKYSIRLMREIK